MCTSPNKLWAKTGNNRPAIFEKRRLNMELFKISNPLRYRRDVLAFPDCSF